MRDLPCLFYARPRWGTLSPEFQAHPTILPIVLPLPPDPNRAAQKLSVTAAAGRRCPSAALCAPQCLTWPQSHTRRSWRARLGCVGGRERGYAPIACRYTRCLINNQIQFNLIVACNDFRNLRMHCKDCTTSSCSHLRFRRFFARGSRNISRPSGSSGSATHSFSPSSYLRMQCVGLGCAVS